MAIHYVLEGTFSKHTNTTQQWCNSRMSRDHPTTKQETREERVYQLAPVSHLDQDQHNTQANH
jgi:hypothetical protein